jgi:hypothetical protein
MAKIAESKLASPTARSALAVARRPYWVRLRPGVYLGYRRNEGGLGSWSARDARGRVKRIALADDKEPAAPPTVLDYWQAREVAKKFVLPDDAPRDVGRSVSLGEALDQYEKKLIQAGADPYNAQGPRQHLKKSAPELLKKPVQLITSGEIENWRDRITGIKPATINRMMKGFWRALKLAGKHDARIRKAAIKEGVEALPDDGTTEFRDMLQPAEVAAIITGAYAEDHCLGLLTELIAQTGTRPIQASRLIVSDLSPDPDRPSLRMPRSGKGNTKNRALKKTQYFTVEIGVELARKLRVRAAGRPGTAPLLLRHDGTPWGDNPHSLYCRQMSKIIAAAGRDPETVTMYWLRHTSICSRLLKNINIRIIAASHDTSIKEIERSYSYYITEHADEINRQFLDEQFGRPDNVVPMRKPADPQPTKQRAIKHAR